MNKQLTPARFVALIELVFKPGPIGHLNKRTAKALMDSRLIDWCDTTATAHIYRATPAGVDAARAHLSYLTAREAAERMFRSNSEQQYQANAAHYLSELEKAVAAPRPETAADRIAALNGEPGPFGVFEDGLCVEVADTRAEADEYAAHYQAEDDATDVTVEPLCVDHRDAEQPRNGCEECLTDSETDNPGVDLGLAHTIAANLGTAGVRALVSADEDGYLTTGHPASLGALERKGLAERSPYPPVGHAARSYRRTPLGAEVARIRAARTA